MRQLLPHGTARVCPFRAWAVQTRKISLKLAELLRYLSGVIQMVLSLQKICSGFCYCILVVLSVKLVLCHRSKMNYFSFTLNTLGNYFPPFSSASNLASALFAVLAVIFWGNCHVLLEITQAKPNLSFSWIVKYCKISVVWVGSKTLIEFPCSWSCVWRSWLHGSVSLRQIGS